MVGSQLCQNRATAARLHENSLAPDAVHVPRGPPTQPVSAPTQRIDCESLRRRLGIDEIVLQSVGGELRSLETHVDPVVRVCDDDSIVLIGELERGKAG